MNSVLLLLSYGSLPGTKDNLFLNLIDQFSLCDQAIFFSWCKHVLATGLQSPFQNPRSATERDSAVVGNYFVALLALDQAPLMA